MFLNELAYFLVMATGGVAANVATVNDLAYFRMMYIRLEDSHFRSKVSDQYPWLALDLGNPWTIKCQCYETFFVTDRASGRLLVRHYFSCTK